MTFLNSTFGTALRALLALSVAWSLIRFGSETRLSGAHWYIVGLLALVAAFQVAVASGFPIGEFTQGGQTVGQLDDKGRKNAVASLPLLVLFALVALHLGEAIQLPTLIGQVFMYVFMGYLGIGLVLNSISRSLKESIIWTPILLLNIYLVAALYFA